MQTILKLNWCYERVNPMARLGKRERAEARAMQARIARVDYSYNIRTSTMNPDYWNNYSGKVCQNIKGSHAKFKASDCLFDICKKYH